MRVSSKALHPQLPPPRHHFRRENTEGKTRRETGRKNEGRSEERLTKSRKGIGKKKKQRGKRGFFSKDHTHKAVIHAALLLWEALDTPRSLGLYLRAKYELWQEIAEARIDPFHYNSADGFRRDYSAINALRKYPELPLQGVDREANAAKKFREAEFSCLQTNTRMRLWKSRALFPMDPRVDLILHKARSKISFLLSDLDLGEVAEAMRWGPGASSANKGAFTSAYHKFDVMPESTLGAIHHAVAAINTVPSWPMHILGVENPCSVIKSAIRVVPGNRVTYVPKDALVDRVIGVEPHMNVYAQLGFGKVIRRRLKRVGVDLDDQTPNQEAARTGASNGNLATVDLSSASDTISTELVEFLIPEHWYRHLAMLRSYRGTLDGNVVEYEKFSSMGNGFTFELESLIFWALSSATLDVLSLPVSALKVYGDDIVIPTQSYSLLVQVFSFCGFEINHRKSFASSPFRESCGAHWWLDVDVKPVYIDSVPGNVLELFGLINQITALYQRLQLREVLKVRDYLISQVPAHDRFFGPPGFGDGYIHGSFEESVPFVERSGLWAESFWIRHFVPVMKKDKKADSTAALTWALYRMRFSTTTWLLAGPRGPVERSAEKCGGIPTLRGDPVRYKLARLVFFDSTYVEYVH